MNQPYRIELLGGLRVRQEERVITRFRTQKAGALLAYLAYFRRQSHPREVLIDLLWPDLEPEAGRNNLSTILSTLRHQLEPPGTPAGSVLKADRFAVGLNAEAVCTDVADFENRLAAAEQAQSEMERAHCLADALACYQGTLLPGHYEAWIAAESRRLSEAYLQATRRLIRTLVRTREVARALDYARRAVEIDPLREEAHHDLMRLYLAAGQPSAALQQFQALERTLHEELSATPSAAIRQLAREIQGRMSAAPAPEPPTAAKPPAEAAPRPVHPAPSPLAPPSGTVTFLLTDIERSTTLWEQAGETFKTALADHHALLCREFDRCGGYRFKETGDGFLVAFRRAGEALECAIAIQQALPKREWPEEVGALRVRMALHTGDVTPQDGDYHGPAVHRAARILAAGHGGQILCSEATASLLRRDLDAGLHLKDLGLYRLRDVPYAAHLFQVVYPGMAQTDFPPLRAETGQTGSLPMQFTRFFGRETELARMQAVLQLPETRLLTLTGPGGTGKTRLAVEAAARCAEAFSGAVWFVPLADVAEARQIPAALVEALRLPPAGQIEPLDRAVEALAQQPALLVLDNFEQLVDAGATLVRTLLERVPGLKCLVTSRQRLELAGEQEFPLSPLPTPQSEGTPDQVSLYESVQLFVDRAQAVKPDFQVTEGNASAVARLCAGLEGIPLALELAAARAQVLTPLQMLAQLEHRFDFLVSRRRDAEARHRTLRAAMDWSYRLLSPELQAFLAQLSVFRGGWDAESAEAVCEEPLALDYLAQLRECSLVLAEETEESGAEMRFRMLETVREYAQERLRETEPSAATQARHRDYFLRLAEAAEPQVRGPEQAFWLARLDREHDNLRAALASCPPDDEGARIGLRIAGALGRFWEIRGHLSEGRRQFQEVLAKAEALGPTTERAKALSGLGLMAVHQGDYAAARASHEESLTIRRALGDKAAIATVLNNLGMAATAQSDYAAAQQFHAESLAIKQELGDRAGISNSLTNLGLLAHFAGDYERAADLYGQSLEIDRELKDQWGIAYSLNSLGEVKLILGDLDAARALFLESLSLRRELGNRQGIGVTLSTLGSLCLLQGEPETARAYVEEGVRILRELGYKRDLAYALQKLAVIVKTLGEYPQARALLVESLQLRQEIDYKHGLLDTLQSFGDLAAAEGQGERAARIWSAVETLRNAHACHLMAVEIAEQERSIAEIRAALGAEAFTAAWEAGRAMSLEQVIRCALQNR